MGTPVSRRLATAIARAEKAGDPVGAQSARQVYYEQKLAEFIEATVAKAPPLRPEQIERLRSLFAPAVEGAA